MSAMPPTGEDPDVAAYLKHHGYKPAPMRIAVLGAGEFGTAMAYVAATNGHDVTVYARDPAQVAHINAHHANPKYLTETALPTCLRATDDVADALAGAQLVIHALPAQTTPDFLRANRALIERYAIPVEPCCA